MRLVFCFQGARGSVNVCAAPRRHDGRALILRCGKLSARCGRQKRTDDDQDGDGRYKSPHQRQMLRNARPFLSGNIAQVSAPQHLNFLGRMGFVLAGLTDQGVERDDRKTIWASLLRIRPDLRAGGSSVGSCCMIEVSANCQWQQNAGAETACIADLIAGVNRYAPRDHDRGPNAD